MPSSRAATGASSSRSRAFPIFFLLPTLAALFAQTPDYDIAYWLGDDFRQQVTPLFRVMALQTAHSRVTISNPLSRVVIGVAAASGMDLGRADLNIVTGKAGVFPSVEGDIWVTSNLRLKGMYSGFVSKGDVISASGYGFDLTLGGKGERLPVWLLSFHQGRFVGMDDFFLKTVGAGIVRAINYANVQWQLGLGSEFWEAGIHVKEQNHGETFHDRLGGGVNSFLLGVSRRVRTNLELGLQVRIHPAFISVMLGFYGILG